MKRSFVFDKARRTTKACLDLLEKPLWTWRCALCATALVCTCHAWRHDARIIASAIAAALVEKAISGCRLGSSISTVSWRPLRYLAATACEISKWDRSQPEY